MRAGAVFRRVHPANNMVETAQVVSIGEDSYGIPHVRFRLRYARPNRTFLEDSRVLALESFTRLYGGHPGP